MGQVLGAPSTRPTPDLWALSGARLVAATSVHRKEAYILAGFSVQ